MAATSAKYGYSDGLRRPEDRFGRSYEHEGRRRVPERDFDLGFGGYGARMSYGPDRRLN